MQSRDLEDLANAVARELMPMINERIDRVEQRLEALSAIREAELDCPARLVDVYALSEAIGLSVPTIHRAVAAGTFPSIKSGRRRLYSVPEVIQAMRKPQGDRNLN